MEAPMPLDRRQRRKLELRARILDVARDLFYRQGARETRVAEICKSAEIAHKTFFNHFPSKHDLHRELALESLEGLFDAIERVCAEEPSLRARLERLFAEIADNMASAAPMRRALVTENIHILNESPEKSEHARRLLEAFGALVRDGVESGEVTRRHSVETLTEMILGAYYVLMFNYANLEGFPIRRHADAAARFLGDSLSKSSDE